MIKHLLFVATMVACALTQAGEQKAWDGRAKPLNGEYQVYGGTPAEMQAPTRKDRKVSFVFKGALAQDLFDQIGPDEKVSCSGDPAYRERNRGHISCTHFKDEGYTCYLGLDVISGKSTHGSIC